MRRIPMMRTPQAASSGMSAPTWGQSGAPMMPPSESGKRARDEVIERYALAQGRFFERVFVFPQFKALNVAGPAQDTQRVDVKSNGGSFVRLVAFRGTFTSTANLTGQEAAQLFLLLEADGIEDFTTSGQQAQPASFDILFSNTTAPWFWFAAPPLIRVGETLAATISTTFATAESTLTPQLALRLVDDDVWCELYGS